LLALLETPFVFLDLEENCSDFNGEELETSIT